ncbi:MAG: GH92 family glycosyl hydrolase [Clostridia bacterium]|nr:GH92 family glycosyl hydrolase [Clostridia bacterium]
MKYIPYVNIKQGSASVHRFSNGNTLPLTQLPFAMAAFSPQTGVDDRWYFHPSARSLEGVRLTHQPSPWIADYGSLILMPQKRRPVFAADRRWSGYRPEQAVLQPHYMSLRFLRSRADFSLAPTVRGAVFRVRFDSPEENWLSVLPLSDVFTCRYSPEENTLYAIVRNCRDDKAVNFRMYAVIRFAPGQISADENIVGTDADHYIGNTVEGDGAGVHLKLTGSTADAVIAVSYISFAQAKENLRQDTMGKTFEDVRSEGEALWESYLSRVKIDARDDRQMRTFYSCMYRAFLYPHKAYEIAPDGAAVHYAPSDGKIHPGVRYTDNGFWDTYRTVYPFYSLVAQEEYREMCVAFVNDYKECGWLPRWPSIGERGCMPSTLIDAVLCDAAVKGLMDRETMETALEGMLKHANVNSPDDDYGRSGAESYVKYGYVPLEVHKESVNLTLDAAYGDWCIARIAELLGKTDLVEEYDARAGNYRNLFDPETGFMRAKDLNGIFRPDFDPVAWGRDYTEGSAWQNSFAVPHDVEGLAALYGGKEAFLQKLDELFATPPVYENAGYESEIHEMTEMAAADFGQCAISNQPSFHLPYLYAACGEVEKTAYWVKRMCEEAFSYEDDGFPGDEDNGSMALWYVFSTIGIYPLCPGKKEWIRTRRLCDWVEICGKPFDTDKYAGNVIAHEALI